MTIRAPVVILLAVGFVARVGIAVLAGNSFEFPDEAVYADAASRLVAGEGFGESYARVPAYPVFLAALVGPLPSSVLLLRVSQAAVTALGALLLYAFASRAIGPRPALGAVFFYAVDPLLVVVAGLLYPEAIAAVLMIGVTLSALIAAREDRLGVTAISGLLLGVLVQLRPVALMLIPVLAFWIAASVPRSRRLLHGGVVSLLCVAAVLPWTYRNLRIHGELMPVATAGTKSSLVSQSEAERRGLTAAIARTAWTEPARFARQVRREFVNFWEFYPTRMVSDDPGRRSSLRTMEPRLRAAPMFDRNLRDTASAISFGCEVAFALLGLIVAWKTHRRETVLMVMVILMFALGYTMFVAKIRYRIPVLPLLFVFAGVGVSAVWEAVRKRRVGGASD